MSFEIGDVIQHKENKRIRVYGWRDPERLKDPENYTKLDVTVEEVFKPGTLVCYRHDIYPNETGAKTVQTVKFNHRYYINGEYVERIETWAPLNGEYCWFWSEGQLLHNGSPHFGKYGTGSYSLEWYDRCIPFTDKVPEEFK